MSNHNRPMSPHLDIYRWRITMLTSTLHRLSGLFLSLGLVVFALWLFHVASDGSIVKNKLFPVFWFFWTLALYYHLCNGIRHLVWDYGKGFELMDAQRSAKIVFIATVILTLLTWIIAA